MRSGSSRIPVGTGHHSNRNLHNGYNEPPSRYDRYYDRYSDDEYDTGYHNRNRLPYRDRNHYASTPGGLNHSYNQDSNHPSAFTSNRSNRLNHYASNPGLSKNVRFRRETHRSMADIRDIEDSIQDIGTSLRDIKSISQSIKDLKYLPQLVDEQIIDRIHRE